MPMRHTTNTADPSSGFSLLEVMISVAILVVVVGLAAGALKNNMQARSITKSKTEISRIEQSFRTFAFRAVSEWAESRTPAACLQPASSLLQTINQSAVIARGAIYTLNRGQDPLMPEAMRSRCRHSHASANRGVYLCFDIKPSPSAHDDDFLKRNRVFAEVNYGFWDASLETAVRCSSFMSTPEAVRGGQMYYNIAWVPLQNSKNASIPSGVQVDKHDGKSLYSFSGFLYSPSKQH